MRRRALSSVPADVKLSRAATGTDVRPVPHHDGNHMSTLKASDIVMHATAHLCFPALPWHCFSTKNNTRRRITKYMMRKMFRSQSRATDQADAMLLCGHCTMTAQAEDQTEDSDQCLLIRIHHLTQEVCILPRVALSTWIMI